MSNESLIDRIKERQWLHGKAHAVYIDDVEEIMGDSSTRKDEGALARNSSHAKDTLHLCDSNIASEPESTGEVSGRADVGRSSEIPLLLLDEHAFNDAFNENKLYKPDIDHHWLYNFVSYYESAKVARASKPVSSEPTKSEGYLKGQAYPCGCHKCDDARRSDPSQHVAPRLMILCSKCGNKRCPHATDHELDCSGSNDPGQKGSVYE